MRSYYKIIYLFLLFFCFSISTATANSLRLAIENYNAGKFDEAIAILTKEDPEKMIVNNYLGLAFYNIAEYGKALPYLQRSYNANEEDKETYTALLNSFINLDMIQEAEKLLEIFSESAQNEPSAWLAAGKTYIALGRMNDAKKAFKKALELEPTSEANWYLTRLYNAEGEYDKASSITMTIKQDPEYSFEASRLENLKDSEKAKKSILEAAAGYRFEYDSNVILEPDDAAMSNPYDSKSDFRHVVTADITGRKNLWNNFSLFGEAHLYNNWYHQLSEFAIFRQNYLGGIGWSGENYGIRLPYEYIDILRDWTRYFQSNTVSPGAYLTFYDITLYGFLRYRNSNFDEEARPSEDRDNDFYGGGLMVLLPFHQKHGLLRVLTDAGKVNSDGKNWERDEIRVYTNLSYDFDPGIGVGIGFIWDKQDYKNVHDIFFIERDDDAFTFFGSISYHITKSWEAIIQGSFVNWNSNIDVYEYNRGIVSFGLNWRY